MAAMTEDDDVRYSAAWIDCLARGASLGRSILSRDPFCRIPGCRNSSERGHPIDALADGAINARERVAIELSRCLARDPDILVVAVAMDERKAEGARERLAQLRQARAGRLLVPLDREQMVAHELLVRLHSRDCAARNVAGFRLRDEMKRVETVDHLQHGGCRTLDGVPHLRVHRTGRQGGEIDRRVLQLAPQRRMEVEDAGLGPAVDRHAGEPGGAGERRHEDHVTPPALQHAGQHDVIDILALATNEAVVFNSTAACTHSANLDFV